MILHNYNPPAPANDDCLFQRAVWDGWNFKGFVPIKWKPEIKPVMEFYDYWRSL